MYVWNVRHFDVCMCVCMFSFYLYINNSMHTIFRAIRQLHLVVDIISLYAYRANIIYVLIVIHV